MNNFSIFHTTNKPVHLFRSVFHMKIAIYDYTVPAIERGRLTLKCRIGPFVVTLPKLNVSIFFLVKNR